MTLANSKPPRPQSEHPSEPPTNKGRGNDRIILLIALLLMLLIAGGFGYRLQISPTGGLTFERSTESTGSINRLHSP